MNIKNDINKAQTPKELLDVLNTVQPDVGAVFGGRHYIKEGDKSRFPSYVTMNDILKKALTFPEKNNLPDELKDKIRTLDFDGDAKVNESNIFQKIMTFFSKVAGAITDYGFDPNVARNDLGLNEAVITQFSPSQDIPSTEVFQIPLKLPRSGDENFNDLLAYEILMLKKYGYNDKTIIEGLVIQQLPDGESLSEERILSAIETANEKIRTIERLADRDFGGVRNALDNRPQYMNESLNPIPISNKEIAIILAILNPPEESKEL